MNDILNLAQIMASEDAELVWRIDRLMPTEGVTLITGQPGAAKTWIAADMAIRIAHGLPVHGSATTQCPVLYVAAEGGSRRMCNRLRRLVRAMGTELTRMEDVHLWANTLCLDSTDDLDRLLDMITATGAGVCILDPLVRLLGDADENNNSDMGKIFVALDRITRATGCDFLVVHHEGKGGHKGTASSRGASAVPGEVASHLSVTQLAGGEIKITQEKNRDDEKAAAYRVRLVDTETTGIKVETVDTKSIARMKQATLTEIISELGGQATIPAVAARLGITSEAARQRLSRACKEGEISSQKRGVYTIN